MTDVIVVGAGPTGLLTAAELAMRGIDVEIIDRLDEPDRTVKAGSINVATAEIFDRRGLLPQLREAHKEMVGQIAEFAAQRARGADGSWGKQAAAQRKSVPAFPVTGHFGGLFFRPDLVDQDDPELKAHTAIADAMLVPQHAVEAILAEHLASLGVKVRRGIEVTGIPQDEQVHLQTSDGELSASWVVGADGGRSQVRKLSGISFDGTDPETTGYQGICDIDGGEKLNPGWNWSPDGIYCYGPIPGRILTVQFTGPPVNRDAPVTVEELQASVRLVSGTDVTIKELYGRATRWTDNARQAAEYRHGRVLLAGDAAHVHSPFSGQGLNLGIGDAINLGWKLAATVQGWAPDGLLDTYHSERHAIGAWVLDWTRAQVALMRGDAKTAQLRRVVSEQLLANSLGMTNIVKLTSGIAQRYQSDGTASVDASGASDGAAGAQVGRLLGDVYLEDGTRLADHCHHGQFVLLDRTRGESLREAVGAFGDRVAVVSDASDESPSGILVRPDGVVIWTSADRSTLTESLGAWLRR